MFKKGMAKVGGRRKGTPNKLTSSFRDAVLLTYESIGGEEAFSKWALANQTEFYRIAARLIPSETRNPRDNEIRVIINRFPYYEDRIGANEGNGQYLVSGAQAEHSNSTRKLLPSPTL